jgi:hypothetical protein
MSKETTTQKPLLADEAAIQERQVTVKVLTIGTKQVTQTLYRQLIREAILDEKAHIRGNVWGWVNLHDADGCKGQSEHLHVIYEHEGQLKQSFLYASYELRAVYQSLNRVLEAKGRAYAYATALEGGFFYRDGERSFRNPFILDVRGRQIKIYPDDAVYRLWALPDKIKQAKQRLIDQEREPVSEWHLKWAREQHDSELKELSTTETKVKQLLVKDYLSANEDLPLVDPLPTAKESYAAMEWAMDQIIEFEQNWRQSYKTIEDAGQLFIAVSGVWK